ncbi:MAG TPA: hypothetical protein VNR60_08915 [Croceibacterium sp.]|nr:hypothetical protein [Croceibacterium sp.]
MTYSSDGTADLRLGERKALREFAPFEDFEPLSKHPRLGLRTLRALCDKGLAEEGLVGVFGPTFRLTERGRWMLDRADGGGARLDDDDVSIEDVKIAGIGPDELEVVLIAQKRRTAVRLNAANARRLAGELRFWADRTDPARMDSNVL